MVSLIGGGFAVVVALIHKLIWDNERDHGIVHTSLDHTLAEHLQLERHGIAESMGTEDVRAAVTAFLEGRASEVEFTGR